MSTAAQHYSTIEAAIHYLRAHAKAQPKLEEVAAHVGLSSFHFQKLFSEWVGVSPKQFLHYLNYTHAKILLKQQQSLFDVAHQTGLSSSSRLHDLFVKITAMSPGEYKNGAQGLELEVGIFDTLFGAVVIAESKKGISLLQFIEHKDLGMSLVAEVFPMAKLVLHTSTSMQQAVKFINSRKSTLPEFRLHLKASPFQLKVWEALLKIPTGRVSTYRQVADTIGTAGAARAVGTAIGSNPIAILIPCHRVIQQSGDLGGYRWGLDRKVAVIAHESLNSVNL